MRVPVVGQASVAIRRSLASARGPIAKMLIRWEWRRVPESNRSSRICNPLRNLSANPPEPGFT
jgi:hypothetical protein